VADPLMNIQFEFSTTRRIVFGPGVIRELGRIAKAAGKRALVVTGRNLKRAEPIIAMLGNHAVAAVPFSVPGEP
jgi:alcohol dehydrogenase class IV